MGDQSKHDIEISTNSAKKRLFKDSLGKPHEVVLNLERTKNNEYRLCSRGHSSPDLKR
jgi:hypothetical protein